MNIPEYMDLKTNKLMIGAVKDISNTSNETSLSELAVIQTELINDLQLNYFGFINIYLNSMVLMHLANNTEPTSKEVMNARFLFKEIALEEGIALVEDDKLKHISFDGCESESFKRLCDALPFVDFNFNGSGFYNIEFKEGKINIG